jgi:hypothetical protein
VTNEEYQARIDALRALPVEEQIPLAVELIGERAASQSAASVVALTGPLRREVELLTTALHELGGAAQRTYAQAYAMNEDGSSWSRLQIEELKRGQRQTRRLIVVVNLLLFSIEGAIFAWALRACGGGGA